jgi:hypothetical protein
MERKRRKNASKVPPALKAVCADRKPLHGRVQLVDGREFGSGGCTVVLMNRRKRNKQPKKRAAIIPSLQCSPKCSIVKFLLQVDGSKTQRLKTINGIQQLVQLTAEQVPSLLNAFEVCFVAGEMVRPLEDLVLRRNVVEVLKRVLLDDIAVLPVDGLVAFDTRRAEEATVQFVRGDAVVAFVLHFAPGRPWGDVGFAELVVGREDGGQAENGGAVGLESG